MTVLALRSAAPADSEFAFALHKAAMGDYVTAVWGWDDRLQRDFHARAFDADPGRWQIISANGTDIGMLRVDRRADAIYLGRIEIHPGHQGRGFGTRLIASLISEARQRDQDLVLEVLAANERARALYRRLGLEEVARQGDGDRDVKITMRTVRPPR
jgi:ribosomal protein S18 acetylase RimI-like enzyme